MYNEEESSHPNGIIENKQKTKTHYCNVPLTCFAGRVICMIRTKKVQIWSETGEHMRWWNSPTLIKMARDDDHVLKTAVTGSL